MRVAVSEMASESGHITDSNVRKHSQGPAHHWISTGKQRRIFEFRQRRHGADPQSTAIVRTDPAKVSVKPAQTDKACGLKQPCLHHQHEGSPAGNRTHASVLGIEKGNSFFESCGLSKFEGSHMRALGGIRSIAAFKFAANSLA